ncbi:hypothetical protein M0G74_17050 [Microbulbifer sp. CAU 1566]|uniref:hypothetical protein n=1 Tax=Microbulbifer sp. CAU 1566 TaxID=2933269 RepID=UPI002002A524|nr:hypothetical protein [Microbulbifer sp. CAU 1566]MCK7598984.1 hypothetical protein [Microbulbifer sp. CAU 1566]
MNLKIIAIYTCFSIVLGIISGIPFGFWVAHDEKIIDSPIYYLLNYMAGCLVSFLVYYFLFKVRMERPILHVVIVGVLSYALAALALYVVAGVFSPDLFLFVDSLLMVFTIGLARHICEARGEFGVRV